MIRHPPRRALLRALTAAVLVPVVATVDRVTVTAEPAGIATTAFEPAERPCRVADTRDDRGVLHLAADTVRVPIAGSCGVPNDAVAAVVTVTVTQPGAAGFLTIWPSETPLPNASTINFESGDDRANGAIVRLGTGGAVDVVASAPTKFVIDVNGWFRPAATATAGRFVPLVPTRVFDSRASGFDRPLDAGESVTVPLPVGVAADAVAVAVNLTTTDPNEPGFFTLHPAGTALPEASALNTNAADQSRAAGAITPVSPGGVTIYAHAGGHAILDVTGWFTGDSAPDSTDGLFVPAAAPQRLVDTRVGDPVWPGGEVEVTVGAAGVAAAAVNVTLVDAHEWGFLTAHAARSALPGTSTVNATTSGETAANFAIAPLSTHGIGIASSGGSDLVVDLAGWFVGTPAVATSGPPSNARPPVCAHDTSPAGLTEFLATRAPFIGGDYQRAFPLPDGRTLWLFQDVAIKSRGGTAFVHNAGLVQSGSCFDLLQGGTYAAPAAYLLPWAIEPFSRWFWPLAGDVGSDGNFHLYVAEMRERSTKYLGRTEPVATWKVTIRVSDLSVIEFGEAADSSPALYGWSVTSDATYTYLYAHCYRQFGWDVLLFSDPVVHIHDFGCSGKVTVARLPRGRFDAAPQYWNGSGWGASRSAAVPVIPMAGRVVNPTQVRYHGGRFVAVTKEGDWWGETIYIDVAPAAQGPWTTYASVPAAPRCGGCNTYFASWLPATATGWPNVIGLSNNTFEGAFKGLYGPSFLTIPAP